MKIGKLLYKLMDFLWPPLKFDLAKPKKKKPTTDELDRWAEEVEERVKKERRYKRGTRN